MSHPRLECATLLAVWQLPDTFLNFTKGDDAETQGQFLLHVKPRSHLRGRLWLDDL